MDLICKGLGKWDARKSEEYYGTYKNLHRQPVFSGDEYIVASTAKNHLCKMKQILDGQDSTFMGTFRISRDIGKKESGSSVIAVVEYPGKVTTAKPLTSPCCRQIWMQYRSRKQRGNPRTCTQPFCRLLTFTNWSTPPQKKAYRMHAAITCK